MMVDQENSDEEDIWMIEDELRVVMQQNGRMLAFNSLLLQELANMKIAERIMLPGETMH